MQKIRFVLQYLRYLQDAKNKYDLHPPFVFDLVDRVLNDTTTYSEYERVERLKQALEKDHRMLEVTDLGAGSKADASPTRSVSSITHHSSKKKKYGRLLFRLVQHFQPETILELGTAMGLSTAYMALGNPQAQVTSIEGCPNISTCAIQNIEQLSLKNVVILTGNFDDRLEPYIDKVPSLEFAFIDGNHRKEPTVRYFEQCLKRISNDSCIVFDDIHWSVGMEQAWDTIRSHNSVTLSIDLFQIGLVFFRKELSKQHFVIRF